MVQKEFQVRDKDCGVNIKTIEPLHKNTKDYDISSLIRLTLYHFHTRTEAEFLFFGRYNFCNSL